MAQSQRRVKVQRPAPITVKVQFVADCDPQNGKPVFKAGSVHDLPAPSANHWIRRGKAERYVAPKKEPKKKAASPPPVVIEKKTVGEFGGEKETLTD